MKLRADVLAKTVGGEEVLLDMKTGSYFGLNMIATRIVQSLREGQSEDQVAVDLAHEFDVEPGQVLADIRSLREQLMRERLLV